MQSLIYVYVDLFNHLRMIAYDDSVFKKWVSQFYILQNEIYLAIK